MQDDVWRYLSSEPHTLVSEHDTLLALRKHHLHKKELDGET